MKYFNKTHAIIMLIIVLAYSQITLHQKLENLTSELNSIQSEVLNTRSFISSELYQLTQKEKTFQFEGFYVIDETLDLDNETIKLSFEVTFSKLALDGDIKLEVSSTDDRLKAFDQYSDYGYTSDPINLESIYAPIKIIPLEGTDNRYIGEIVLDLNKNYSFALLVDDGNAQTKEQLGLISAQEWYKSPSNIRVEMKNLMLTAPSAGQFYYDLFIGNQNSIDPFSYVAYSNILYEFDAIRRISPDTIKSLTYKVYRNGLLLETFEESDLKWENEAIKIRDVVNFISDITKDERHEFKFEVTMITESGEVFESEYTKSY